MSYPLISVITVVYNAVATVKATLDSVLDQDKALFEYVIIDGGSADGSVDVIRSYESQLAVWVSERDKGIYDAMNKGIERSKGEWLYFLGADDLLQPDVLKQLSSHLIPPYKLVFGDVRFSNNHLMRSFLGPMTLMQNTLHHQGTFYHRSLFNDFRYDSSLSIQADYELNIRAYVQGLPTKYVPIVVSTYALGGASAGHTEKSYNEINMVRARQVKGHWRNASLALLLRFYYWQKQVRFWLYGHQI